MTLQEGKVFKIKDLEFEYVNIKDNETYLDMLKVACDDNKRYRPI